MGREVDPQANFETRKEEKKTTQRSGSTSEICDQKGRKKKRPSEVDPQANFETRKEGKKNDPEKWIHKRILRPERKEKNDPEKWIHKRNLRQKGRKKTTQRSGSTSEI